MVTTPSITSQKTVKQNSIGIASHSGTGIDVQENLLTSDLLAGITSVNTWNSDFVRNTINGSENGIFLDDQSSNNIKAQNQAQNRTYDISNANGLPMNVNNNQFGSSPNQ